MNTPIGQLDIQFTDNKNGSKSNTSQLTSIKFTETEDSIEIENPDSIINQDNIVTTQLSEYFKGTRNKFDFGVENIIDHQLKGTTFQKKVWRAIYNIPYGTTKTYSNIATEIGSPKAYRAVANACSGNPIAIIIPCHRVVGKTNRGGYKWGQHRKEWLLDFEKNIQQNLLHKQEDNQPQYGSV